MIISTEVIGVTIGMGGCDEEEGLLLSIGDSLTDFAASLFRLML